MSGTLYQIELNHFFDLTHNISWNLSVFQSKEL